MKLRLRKSAQRDVIDLGYLHFARESAAYWRLRSDLSDVLTEAECDDVRRAVLFAGLRFASFWYRVRNVRGTAAVLLTLGLYASVWLIEEAIAFAILRDSIGPVSLAVDVWAGAATGWLAVSFRFRGVLAPFRGMLHRDLREFWSGGAALSIALGLVGLAIVAERVEDAAVTPREKAVLQLGAVALGAAGGLAAARIDRTAWRTVDRVLLIRDSRVRPRDGLLTDLVYVAWIAHEVRRGSDGRWHERGVVRDYARHLDVAAGNIERAPGLAGTVPWWHFRLRAQIAEPYAAVAAVVRAHRVKVLAAQDVEQWRAIHESLASGALAAARRDWAALTANAPASGPARRSRLVRAARRLSSTVVLLACAIVLPQILNLGAYGSSVRAILSVSAALALLPGDAGGVVRDTLSKAMPWQR